jgi:hypothetical protein
VTTLRLAVSLRRRVSAFALTSTVAGFFSAAGAGLCCHAPAGADATPAMMAIDIVGGYCIASPCLN